MTIEATIEEALFSDELLNSEFSERREEQPWFYSAGSLGIGPNVAVPERPYIVQNELPSIPYQAVKRTSNAKARYLTFYVYDEKGGDYSRINRILSHLERIFKSLAPFVAPDGTRCSDIELQGFSGRIPDDGYDSEVRFATVRFTVSQ